MQNFWSYFCSLCFISSYSPVYGFPTDFGAYLGNPKRDENGSLVFAEALLLEWMLSGSRDEKYSEYTKGTSWRISSLALRFRIRTYRVRTFLILPKLNKNYCDECEFASRFRFIASDGDMHSVFDAGATPAIKAWETAFVELLKNWNKNMTMAGREKDADVRVEVLFTAAGSFPDESEKAINSDVGFLVIGYSLLFMYATCVLSGRDWVRLRVSDLWICKEQQMCLARWYILYKQILYNSRGIDLCERGCSRCASCTRWLFSTLLQNKQTTIYTVQQSTSILFILAGTW